MSVDHFSEWNATQRVLTLKGEPYDRSETIGVSAIVVAGGISLLTILIYSIYLAVAKISRLRNGEPFSSSAAAHVGLYVISLFVSNTLQSIGTVMSARWIQEAGVQWDSFCVIQAIIKQVGNVGTALWSLIIAIHIFDILFMRWHISKLITWSAFFGTWSLVGVVVIIGPARLEEFDRLGPFFGVAGRWCWITAGYPLARIMLEYFFMFLSCGLSFLLYIMVFLRIRGNIQGKGIRMSWHWVPRNQSWRLAIGRDNVDHAMYKMATTMAWYPIGYFVVIAPIAIARLSEFAGSNVPFPATVFAGVLFNLNGFINCIIFAIADRMLPDKTEVPTLTLPRKQVNMTLESGITPFVLPPQNEAEDKSDGFDDVPIQTPLTQTSRRSHVPNLTLSWGRDRLETVDLEGGVRRYDGSLSRVDTTDSQAPFGSRMR